MEDVQRLMEDAEMLADVKARRMTRPRRALKKAGTN
jgi:hypothetical protein